MIYDDDKYAPSIRYTLICDRSTILIGRGEEKWVSVSSGYTKVGKIENCSRDHFPIALSWASIVKISQRNISHC